MAQPTYYTLTDPDDRSFDLSSIFIAREQQLDLFDIYLTRWKNLILTADSGEDTLMIAPSPNNKLQGLLVLLYGHGGFGKSTLLKHYEHRASEEQQHITVSAIVDWEHAVEGKRTLFNPALGQEVDVFEYYRVLCTQLAMALSKPLKDFKNYHTGVKNFEDARRQAGTVLDRMQSDDRYADLRGLTVDMLSTLIGTLAPAPFSKLATSDKTKEIANEGIKVGVEMVAQIHTKLRDALGNKLGDYLDAPLRLGTALGRDLHDFAKNFPHLIFFDTYEEIDTADRMLRIVMGTSGMRVGWILAGRDNLWGGSEQRQRSITKEYGYKDIVPADRGLPIDFNVGGVGAFTLSDIQQYFDQLCQNVCYEPPLPSPTENQIEQILNVTQGIPLAVSIAAATYLETGNIEQVTEVLDGQHQIVEQMVERYLLHARDEQSERLKLYGLALLRRADQPLSIAAALGLNEEDARTNYERELSRLHRRYSFIFTEKGQPSLHQEVRHFLRLWLLERRRDPEIVALNTHLKAVCEAEIKRLEERRQYKTLQDRLQDDEWIGIYLDLVEQQFWLDSAEGLQALLILMIAAAIYRRDFSADATELGTFFAEQLGSPYNHWWTWAFQGLSTDGRAADQKLAGLQNLARLMEHQSLIISPFLLTVHLELEAILWWKLAETFSVNNKEEAFRWYEKTLTRLSEQHELKEAAAQNILGLVHELYKRKKYAECLALLNRAIDLKPDDAYTYNTRGNVYSNLREHQQAIQNYTQAAELAPTLAIVYNNRGSAYYEQKEYQQAILDYNQAITLDPKLFGVYNNRGLVYLALKKYQRAIHNFDQAIELDAKNARVYYNRGLTCRDLKEYQQAIHDFDQAIKLGLNDAVAYYNRGLTYRDLNAHQQAIHDFDQAIKLAPNNAAAYNGRGLTYRDLKEYQRAIHDYTQAIELAPHDAAVYHNRGLTYQDLKEYQQAIHDYTRAIELAPNDAAAHNGRGNVYGNLKEYQQAIHDYTRAIELDPNYAAAYYNRGLTHRNRKEYQRALQDFDQAIELAPNDAAAYEGRGSTYLYLRSAEQAKADYNRCYKHAQTNNNAAWMSEWVAMGKQRIGKEVAQKLETIATLNIDSYIGHICLGIVLGLQGKLKEGLQEMNKAISLKPEECDAYFWKGMLSAYHYRGQSSIEKTRQAIEQALAVELPPILLTPLYWLEKDVPDVFDQYAKPLLQKYDV